MSAFASALVILVAMIITLWFTDMPPAEYAIISFENRTIQPLRNVRPWFSPGSFGIDRELGENGRIDLLIHYIANHFEQK